MVAPTRMIAVRLLGEPELTGWRGAKPFPRKGFLLLAVLATAPAHRLKRRDLASLLWESTSSSVAMTNLRQLLVRIKPFLAAFDRLLVLDSEHVALGEDRDVIDVCAFKMAAKEAHFEATPAGLALYRGALLTGADEPGEQFLAWIATERTALHETYFPLASRYLAELTRYGRASKLELTQFCSQMLALEPEREATYRTIMQAFGHCGYFDEVDRHHAALKEMLLREYGTTPAPETAMAVRRIFSYRGASDAPTPSQQSSPRLPKIAFLAPRFVGDQHHAILVRMLFEDIANELGCYQSFLCLAPNSSFASAHDGGIPTDNSLLHADYTLSGFLRPDNNRDELSLRLVNCASSEIVWSGRFGVHPRDLLKSFGQLSTRIAASLASALERDFPKAANRSGDPSAYFHYLEGQRELTNCDLAQLRRARRLFAKSAALNPFGAHAKARIAQTLYLEWIQLGGNEPQLLSTANTLARSAVSANPNDAIGHLMEATIALYQRDFEVCQKKFSDAEDIAPNSPDLLIQHADALAHLGDGQAAWRRYERALDLNPSPPDHYWWAGASIAFCKNDYPKVISICERLRSKDSVLGILGSSHAFLGQMDEARAYGNRIKELYPGVSAAERIKVVPDRPREYQTRRLDGLRMMGIH